MNTPTAIISLALLCGGCRMTDEVEFVYFNLDSREIRVVQVIGLPRAATPGVLVPVLDETSRLNKTSVVLFEPVQIQDHLKLIWEENGQSHFVDLRREDLKLPAQLRRGRVRLTYTGDDHWRITRFAAPD